MSRIGLEIKYKDYIDDNAIIGYDDTMKTWFLQAFEVYNKDTDSDELLLWLGSQPEEFPHINQLLSWLSDATLIINFGCMEWEKEFYEQCAVLEQLIDRKIFNSLCVR